jgi:hypothetical protein
MVAAAFDSAAAAAAVVIAAAAAAAPAGVSCLSGWVGSTVKVTRDDSCLLTSSAGPLTVGG